MAAVAGHMDNAGTDAQAMGRLVKLRQVRLRKLKSGYCRLSRVAHMDDSKSSSVLNESHTRTPFDSRKGIIRVKMKINKMQHARKARWQV